MGESLPRNSNLFANQKQGNNNNPTTKLQSCSTHMCNVFTLVPFINSIIIFLKLKPNFGGYQPATKPLRSWPNGGLVLFKVKGTSSSLHSFLGVKVEAPL